MVFGNYIAHDAIKCGVNKEEVRIFPKILATNRKYKINSYLS